MSAEYNKGVIFSIDLKNDGNCERRETTVVGSQWPVTDRTNCNTDA
jgi:hypothetical protein